MITLAPSHKTAPQGTSRWDARAPKGQGFAADNSGQATLEWALVLAAVALPMYFVIIVLLNLLVAHFQMVTFMETLPFP